MDVDGDVRSTDYGLAASQPTPGAQESGDVSRNIYGFFVDSFGSGSGSFTPLIPRAKSGDKRVLAITAGGGPDAPTRVSLVDRAGRRHVLGTAVNWQQKRVDVSKIIGRGGRATIEFTATNSGSAARLVGDRVMVLSYPESALPEAGRWEVAAWVGLIVLLVLALLRRVRRDFLAAAAAAVTAFAVWPQVVDASSQTLSSGLWDSARDAKWFD